LEKQVRIESGERRITQDVHRLAEILVPQSEGQGQRWRGLPGVLKKVRLPEVVRVEDGGADSSADASRLSAEIIEKVRQSRVARRITIIDLALAKSRGLLGCKLPQQLRPVSEDVAPAQFRLGLLE